MAGLTPKQQAFVNEYLIDLNATQAAIRAGYSEDTATEQGSRLLTNVKVKNAIGKAMKDREHRTLITQDRVLQELAKIGFANITDYLKVDDFEYTVGYKKDEEGNDIKEQPIMQRVRDVEIFKTADVPVDKIGAVAEIKRTKDGISLKLHDKVKALEDMGRHLGMFTDKVDHNVNMTFGIKLPDGVDDE